MSDVFPSSIHHLARSELGSFTCNVKCTPTHLLLWCTAKMFHHRGNSLSEDHIVLLHVHVYMQWHKTVATCSRVASFPGLSHFLFYGFRSVQYTEPAWKTGKAWEHLSREWRLVDTRWTYGGRGPHSNNTLDFIIERSNDSQDSWGSQDRQYLTSLVRNSPYRLLHTSWLMGNAPYIIHVIGVSRCSPFFVPLPCIIVNKNRRTKNGGGLGTRL